MLSIVVDKKQINEDFVIISNIKDIRHLINVYRLNVDDYFRVTDGEYQYICKIFRVSKKEILAKIENKDEDIYSLNINIDVAIGLIKNDKMSLLIKKLTEIGVRNIIPLKTERVVVKIDNSKSKWSDIVTESMKQCRAVKRTNISEITNLRQLDFSSYDKVIYLYEKSLENKKITEVISSEDKNILCIIGPEGGFTKNECNILDDKNAIQISLGNRILRAETAAIVVCAILSHSYGY